MPTSNDVANQALQLIGGNMPPVSGYAPTFDTTTAGQALAKLYVPAVQTVGRQFGWDFARNAATLATTANTPSPGARTAIGYAYEYAYPTGAIEILALTPSAANFDVNNPLPLNFTVVNTLVSGVQVKVIQADEPNAVAICSNTPSEAMWDPLFREAVVRLLASELSMALFGRPDSADSYLQSGAAFENLGEGRPD